MASILLTGVFVAMFSGLLSITGNPYVSAAIVILIAINTTITDERNE